MSVNDSQGAAAGIPVQMHAAVLRNLRTPLVFEGLTSREYEGDISNAGDAVDIITYTPGTIGNYVRGTAITAQTAVLAKEKLVITEQKDFAIEINDLDVKQVKPDFADALMSDQAFELKKSRDSFVSALMRDGTPSANDLGDFSVGTGPSDADAFEILARLATVLDDNDTPDAGNSPSMDSEGGPDGGMRFVVVPPFFAEMLVVDPRKSSFGTTDNLRTYGERYIGRSVAGLEIFKSNQCAAGGGGRTTIQAGWSRATAFAAQLLDFKTQDKQLDFAKYHLGLDVYGGKVIRPSNLAYAEAVRA
jgi:hypothetical protein